MGMRFVIGGKSAREICPGHSYIQTPDCSPFVSRTWNELVVDENFWLGSYDCLAEKLADWDCHPISGISFKMQREKDSCLTFLTIGRQEIPLFVVHYVAPQQLPVEEIIDGIRNLKTTTTTSFFAVKSRAHSWCLFPNALPK